MKLDWTDIAKRTIATVCETAIALLPAGMTIEAVDWKVIVGTTALAALVTFLKCVGAQVSA